MKQLIEFPLEDGSTILVEVDEPESAGGTARVARRGDKIVEKANQSFETALDKVKPTANAVIAKLRGLYDPPDEISVEFGIKLSAETGVVLAAAGMEANFKVTLKWQKNQK
ncbi:MAG: hypothetical protein KAT58_01495 [candidate division Zixibacteria bacterium]|nr:hypothetical protein [candidate division Zixibacteria bacterium]